MKKLAFLVIVALVCIMVQGCENDEKIYVAKVYGTVFDKVTGQPLPNIMVKLVKGYSEYGDVCSSSVTGDDGTYEITVKKVAAYNYVEKTVIDNAWLVVEKDRYSKYVESLRDIYDGDEIKVDILLEPW